MELPKPRIVGDFAPTEPEVRALEEQAILHEAIARSMHGTSERQTGSIRGVQKRRVKNKAARQARKRNRR